ncbi:MAG: helicase C-terminal domain-containing protein [Acidobacteriota bacterium]|nr:helicase C-terminal domain-containing protein [Acidobacteriota bacterium]
MGTTYTAPVTVRFDEETKRLQLSVADLLERESRRSLGFGNRGGFERMWLGQAIHSAYQGKALERDPTYRSEVWLEVPFPFKGWEVLLGGRTDGLRRGEAGELVVEEIKSVRKAGQLAPALRDSYERQAAIYTWMLCQTEDGPVRAELILIEIGTYDIERIELASDSRAVEAGVRRRVAQIISHHDSRQAQRDARQLAAGSLRFPYQEIRPGQQEVLDAVTQAVEGAEHLFVEAPTGMGKTVAALYPVIRHALSEDKKVYVLTAKNLQQEMASRVLRLLNPEDAFRSMRLRAKARMCANGEVICHEEYCHYARDYFLKLEASRLVSELMADHADLQPDAIFAQAKEAEICPFEVSLELARETHAVVCDYNYVFDPYVALRRFAAGNSLDDVILVIDEAHNLVDRGRGYYSPELVENDALDVVRLIGPHGVPIIEDIRMCAQALADLIRDNVAEVLPPDSSDGAVEIRLPEDALWKLRPDLDAAFIGYLEYQRDNRTYRAEDPFVGLYFSVVRFLDAAAAANESFGFLAKRESGRASLKILCRDAGRFLGDIINRTHSTIALSATLSPAEFYSQLLGFDAQRSSTLAVPSPFPRENRRIVVDASVTTLWKQRGKNAPLIANRIAEFVGHVPGNCLVLFPSYVFLEEVAGRLPTLKHRVIIQRRGDGPEEREALLEQLRNPLFGRTVLLSVAGGVFAEGVDYPGDTLEAVAVVGPCLPAVTLEQKLLQQHYDERFERGFEYAFVVPGMTRVIQAAGRLIRSAEDRGVIALLDRRFTQRPYADHLPGHWLDGAEPKSLIGNPAQVAAEFFEAEGRDERMS